MKTKLRVFDTIVYISCRIFFLTYKTINAKHSPKTYCIVCKNDTENKNPNVFKTKNERLILKPVCSECNNKKSKFSLKMKDLVYYQV